jgi:hypothetical protein
MQNVGKLVGKFEFTGVVCVQKNGPPVLYGFPFPEAARFTVRVSTTSADARDDHVAKPATTRAATPRRRRGIGGGL